MERYDPLEAPVAGEWLDLDEEERLGLVKGYHRRARTRLPNLDVHASFHAVVENQAAMGDEIPVRRTLERLMKEGIDRHQAIHAVASVLSEHILDIAKKNVASDSDPNAAYYAALERLTVETWRQSYGD